MAIGCILTDVEGTTSSIAFVAEILFPYAARHLPAYIDARRQDAQVRQHLDGVRRRAGLAEGDDSAVAATLLQWIAEDRKDPDLKALQGLVWEDGFRSRAFTAHVYPEVPGLLVRWHARGLRLAVYSSGSIHAQRLFFGHCDVGDLTRLFTAHFDTGSGGKREAASYAGICRALAVTADEVLFLSDVLAELDAAAAAGLRTHLICRAGDLPRCPHPVARDFAEVDWHWRLGGTVAAGAA